MRGEVGVAFVTQIAHNASADCGDLHTPDLPQESPPHPDAQIDAHHLLPDQLQKSPNGLVEFHQIQLSWHSKVR